MLRSKVVEKFPATQLIAYVLYDLEALRPLMDDIRKEKQMHTPVHVEWETKIVLAGSRRVLAVQELLRDPTLDPETRANLENIDVRFHDKLTDAECKELRMRHYCCGS